MRKGPQQIKIAYRVPGPAPYLMLEVRGSANAWWMDRNKIYSLLQSFRNMIGLPTACHIAGITLRQYRYFARLHPIIEDRRHRPYAIISMKAKTAWVKKIHAGDLNACRKWLEMTQPETYSMRYHRSALADLRRRHGIKGIKGGDAGYRAEIERIHRTWAEIEEREMASEPTPLSAPSRP